MKKGFTLVELSIVLVIIGLLIGGLLISQSMIQTAKIQQQVKQLESFDVMVANFKTKYNQLPGDSNLFSPEGNNNGFINELYNGVATDPTTPFGLGNPTEGGNFWKHVSDSGASPTIGPFLSAGSNSIQYQADINAPKAVLGQDGTVVVGTGSTTENFWMICYNNPDTSRGAYCGGIPPANFDFGGGALTPAVALAMDSKIDDGIPNTGSVTAVSQTGSTVGVVLGYVGHNTGVPCLTFIYTDPAARYNVDYKENACSLKILMAKS